MSLSIIIPTLNEEKYVGKLLDCLIKQTYKEFEVIVVDGHSEDKTKKVVLRYKKRLDLKLINSKKTNVAHQRNLGAQNAKYERLLFLDADCKIPASFLNRFMSTLHKKKLEVATCKVKLDNGRFFENLFFLNINLLFKLLKSIKPYSLGAIIYCNKTTHSKINGFKNVFGENYDYITGASKYARFGFITECIVFTSPRRFRSIGMRNTIKVWLKSFIYHFFTGKQLNINYKYNYEK